MAFGRLAGVYATAAVAAVVLGAVGMVQAAPFEAVLGPAQAVQVEGVLEARARAPADLVAAWTPAGGKTPITLRVDSVSVLDVRWGVSVATDPAYRITNRPIGLKNPELRVDSIAPDGRWIVLGMSGRAFGLSVAGDSQCVMSPQNASAVRLLDDLRAYPTEVWKPARPTTLAAHCRSDAVSGSGAARLIIAGASVRVAGTNPITGAFEQVSAVAESTEGRFAALDVRLPAQDVWRFPGGVDVWIQSEGVRVVGEITVPPNSGGIRWADRTMDGAGQVLAPQGTFTVNDANGRIRIRGESSNLWAEASVGLGATAIALELIRRGGTALFTRLAASHALDNPRRRLVLDAVTADPGIHIEALARRIGVGGQSARYHAAVLRRHGLLRARAFGRRTALFPPSTRPDDERRLYELRKASAQSVVEILVRHPGLSQRELVRAARMSQSRVSKILSALLDAKLVRVEKRGHRLYYPAAAR